MGGKSRSIYQRLFNAHFEQKNTKKCKEVLESYVRNYPYRNNKGDMVNKKDHKKQQLMLTRLLDYMIAIKNVKNMAFWVERLEDGYLEFDQKYVARAKIIRSEIIFGKIKKQKDPLTALGLFREVYHDRDEHARRVRLEAAFHAGESSIWLIRDNNAFKWFKRSLNMMSLSEMVEFHGDFLNNIQNMVYLQSFEHAHGLSSIFLNKYCSKKSAKLSKLVRKNDFYSASITYALMDGKHKMAFKNFQLGEKCEIKEEVQIDNLKYMSQFYLTHRKYGYFKKLYAKYRGYNKPQRHFSQMLLTVYWDALLRESSKEEKFSLKYLKQELANGLLNKRSRLVKEVKAAIDFNQLKEDLANEVLYHFPLHTLQGSFNEKHFNENLESHLAELKGFTLRIADYIGLGYPQIVSYGHQILYRRYLNFGKSLLGFKPWGVDKNYQKSFVKTVSQLGHQFMREAETQKRMAMNLLKKDNILLSRGRNLDLGDGHVANVISYRHPASAYAVTLDRDALEAHEFDQFSQIEE